MLKVLAGAGAVILVVLGVKYLSSRSQSPGPPSPPPPPTDPIPSGGADAGADSG
jgi:hypothetical protein